MIRISNVRFTYPDQRFSLQIPSWEVTAGDQVAIVGPSGSGKTTLLHLLAGILKPQQGSILLGDFEMARATDAQRRDYRANHIGMVFQQFELLDYLNVRENILLPFRINRELKLESETREHLENLLTQTGIQKLANQSVRQLSQGERQRVAICRALVTRPSFLLTDEPTGNLDPDNKHLIVELLQKQASSQNAILLMVTHDTSLTSTFAQTVDFEQWRQRLSEVDS